MKTAIKTEFICVKPKSSEAEYRFEHDMYKLHSCRVVNRKNGKVVLASITDRYSFEIFEGGDDNWEVIK